MNQRTAAVWLVAGWAFCAVPVRSQKPTSGASPQAEKAAFDAVCGTCHPASMAEGLRTPSEWTETIEQMVKTGAAGTDEQFTLLMRYLLRTWTKVNVNTAPAAQLAPFLDISDTTAGILIKRRIEKGPFKTLEDLKRIPGVDPAKIEARKDRIAF